MPSRRFVLGLAPAAVLAACASPNPVLYTLAPVPGTPRAGGPRVVELRTIGLPRYLDRTQIVRSSENYQLDVMANNWWGEPLGAMMGRILVSELSQRLPDSSVYSDAGAISSDPDAIVEINIQRFDADSAGNLILTAQFAVRWSAPKRPGVTRPFSASVPASLMDLPTLVSAMSTAVGQLADAIAGALI